VHIFYCLCFVLYVLGLIFVLPFHSASRLCIFYSFPACIIDCWLALHTSVFRLLLVGPIIPCFILCSKALQFRPTCLGSIWFYKLFNLMLVCFILYACFIRLLAFIVACIFRICVVHALHFIWLFALFCALVFIRF